jgi:uncharacterized membrane protein YebE (DUF533 family)
MIDSRALLDAMLRSGMGGRNANMGRLEERAGGMHGSGGGIAGALAGMLGGRMAGRRGRGLGGLTGRRRSGGMQGMLLGVLGGIAVSALQRRMQQSARGADAEGTTAPRSAAPAMRPASPAVADATQAGSTLDVEQAAEVDEGRAQLLVRVMVAAANADMEINQEERRRILDRMGEAGADPEAREFIEREMRSPMSIDDIARQVSGPDVAAQAYAAALAAIDVDKAMERRFLEALAARTGLDQEVVDEIHDQLGQPRLER